MSPSLALAYFVWTRHRLSLALIAGYWLVLILLCRTLSFASISGGIWAIVFSAFCVTAFTFLLTNVSLCREVKLETRESGFPSRLWSLPLPTYALVGWPMLWGCGTVALAWLTLSWGALQPAFRPHGMEPPLWWPALTLAAAVAWLQALAWTPFPLSWVRAFVLIPLLGPVAILFPVLELYAVPPAIAYGSLVALLLAAYGVAVAGVARARRGDGAYWDWPGWSAWLRWISSARARPAFASPLRAQVWFEWRRVGLGFPIMIFACSLVWLPMIPLIAEFIDKAQSGGLPLRPPFLLREVGSLWVVVSDVLLFAPFLASVCSMEMGKLPGRERSLVLSSFLATRPVSAWTLVRAKFEAAALTILAGWGVAVVGLLLWFALGGHAAEMVESFGAFRQRHPGVLLWIGLVLLVGGSIVLTWLQMVQGLWIGLAGSAWAKAIAALGFVVFVGLLCVAQWLVKSPQYWQFLSDLLPWLTGAVVALKGVAAVWVCRILIRRNLVPTEVVCGGLAVWVVSAVGIIGLLYWLLPRDQVSISALVLGITLTLPLTRLAVAPLALTWNRHR
jgi:hypothetical protein